MILEGIVTTTNEDGSPNISPMGPIVDREVSRLELRPYQPSRTYQNLKRHPEGIFHITDDVELLARCAVGSPPVSPTVTPATAVRGWILSNSCRWYAFRAVDIDDKEPRTTIRCEIVERGKIRDFFGFNRAKHAVLEAAILATRLHLLPREEILREFARLEIPVQKTAGDQEERAFEFLKEYVQNGDSHA